MKQNSQIKIAAASFGLLGVLFTMQNCGTTVSPQHVYPASPFEESKLLLTPEFAAQQKLTAANGNALEGSATIVLGTELSVIVKDKCIRDRQAEVSPITYWVDSYITKDTPLGNELDFYSETAIGIVTKSAFTVDQLNDYAKLDGCIVGISNTKKIAYRAATDPASTQADLLNALEFTAGDAILRNEIPATVKVRVAILDSGIDHTNTSLAANIDNNYSTYFDFLGTIVGATVSRGNQDILGTGTQLASLIVGDSARSFTGLAARNVVLLPIKIRNNTSQVIDSYHYLNMIKLAVNMRADVINLATSDVATGCDPLVGHAMLQAVRRNAFIVLSSGDNIEPDALKPRRAGAFVTVKDNGPLFQGITVAPGCWGRYLKGVIAVSASNMAGSALASFSNWGEDAAEMAAPGLSIRAVHHNKTVINSNSILLPTAMVTAGAAMTIAYHKAKTWSYDPWLIEDIMMNAMPTRAGLVNLIRRGKFLSFASLANYLKLLESKTADQRLAENSDNPELNGGWNPEAAVAQNLLSIDLYAKLPMLQVGKRIQFNTVAYYTDAVIKVVTESGTTYTSSNSAIAEVNSQGVVIAKRVGQVTITAAYQGKTAQSSVSIVDYDVIEGPANELVDLELTYDFNESYGNCPFSAGGLNSSVSPQAYAIYGDGSRVDVTKLISLVPQATPEIGTVGAGPSLSTGNWYGGRTYTLYGLYRGKKAKLDVKALQAPYERLQFSHASPGGTFSITQDKNMRIGAGVVVGAGCSKPPTQGDTEFMKTSQIFTSPDADLDSFFKQNALVLDLYKLTVGKTYTIHVNYGAYRGNGVEEALPTHTYYMKIDPADVKDIQLFPQIGAAPLTSPIPLGLYRYVRAQMEDSAGKKQDVFPYQLAIDFIDKTTGQKLQAPRGLATPSLSTNFDLWIFPPAGGASNVDLVLTHLPTGFKKTFPISATGIERFTGSDTSAPAFNWSQFSMSSNSKTCAQGANTNRLGEGTANNPYIVCSAQQLIDTGLLSTDIRTSPYVHIGRALDFTGIILPKKPLLFNLIHGGGHSVSGVTYAAADEEKIVFVTNSISNIEFKQFALSTRSSAMVAANYIENVRFVDGTLLSNEGQAYLLGNFAGGTIMAGRASNIRVENVEMQGRYNISPIASRSNAVIDNFGARNLTIRSSSVAGSGTNIGGIVDTCNLCTITSSSTSGQIGQVNSSVGGITGKINMGRFIAVTSNMNIAATGDKIGGIAGSVEGQYSFGVDASIIAGETWAAIYNSSFTGTVRGRTNVGGITGLARNSFFENVSVGANSLVQGTNFVGGVAGESQLFNHFHNATVDANLYSTGKLHPIASATGNNIFRPADRFSNLKFKGYTINLEPEMLAEPRPANTPLNVMPSILRPPAMTPAQLGLTVSVQGASLSNGVYVLNLGSAVQGSTPAYRNVQINGSNVFHVNLDTTTSIAFNEGNLNLSSGGTGYTRYGFGIGLPTDTMGSVNRTSTIYVQTSVGRAELKIQVLGTITAP